MFCLPRSSQHAIRHFTVGERERNISAYGRMKYSHLTGAPETMLYNL